MLDPRIVCFCLLIVLGFLAGFITPVVSALVFVEAISLLRCDRWVEIAATVFACFAIGFGAGLTPLGMPGIAVVLRSLHAGFWYLAHLLGPFIVAGVILAALPTLFLPFASSRPIDVAEEKDSWNLVLLSSPRQGIHIHRRTCRPFRWAQTLGRRVHPSPSKWIALLDEHHLRSG